MRGPAPALDPRISEWAFMCTGGSGQNFPYGASAQACVCAFGGCDGGTLDSSAPVGSLKGCRGGFPGLADMVGNVSEWENSYDTLDSGYFRVRGNAYESDFTQGCDWDHGTDEKESLTGGNRLTGIRCCGP